MNSFMQLQSKVEFLILQFQSNCLISKFSILFFEMFTMFYCHRVNKSKRSMFTGEACWWTVHPASKQRSEGEKVRVGDDLILVSVATERYLVSDKIYTFL